MTPRIREFLATDGLPTPCLVVDLDVVERNYRQLQSRLPEARIYYAVKANPARSILDRLHALGSCFDAASLSEVLECLASGAGAERISYGNTIKKQTDIAHAYDLGCKAVCFR